MRQIKSLPAHVVSPALKKNNTGLSFESRGEEIRVAFRDVLMSAPAQESHATRDQPVSNSQAYIAGHSDAVKVRELTINASRVTARQQSCALACC